MKIIAYLTFFILLAGSTCLAVILHTFDTPNAFSNRDGQGAAGILYFSFLVILAVELIFYLLYFWLSYQLITQGRWPKTILFLSPLPILVFFILRGLLKL